jgi:hypothetical protein
LNLTNKKMAKNKTTETTHSVADFIATVADATKRTDCLRIIELAEARLGLTAKMWGPSIIGFGSYHYQYESGRTGDAPLVGFSPRAAAIVFYIADYAGRTELLARFGKHTLGKGCIYIKKLADIDTDILQTMLTEGVAHTRAKYPT